MTPTPLPKKEDVATPQSYQRKERTKSKFEEAEQEDEG